MMLLLALATLPAPPCQPVEGDRIHARDLARIEPAFAALPADTQIGFAPVPGARRIMSATRITRLAREHGIQGGPFRDVCFQYAVQPLAVDEVRAAMRRSLPDAVIDVVEVSRFPVPAGTVEFPTAGLGGGPGGTRLWRGAVRYGERKSVPVWARVKVAMESTQVVAARDLRAGRMIESADLALSKTTRSHGAEKSIDSVDDAVGRRMRRALRAGDLVVARQLTVVKDIEAGDTIHVEVAVGSARLKLDAVAETGGAAGSRIVLRNPGNGRRFLAMVEGKGKVAVIGPAEGGRK